MLDDSVYIKVRNRSCGSAGYTIPDKGNLHRNFEANEIKNIPMGELRALSWSPGGTYLIKKCFVLNEPEAIQELLGDVEPEYYYGEKEVKELLLHGSLAQLQDCLDFAPMGVIDLIKSMATTLEINDLSKREEILKKTGFDVTKAVEINKMSQEESAPVEEKVRRAEPIVTTQPTRRATPVMTIADN